MRSNSVLVAALAALASVAVAEPVKPKIYFPRHVKRQYTNTTGTASDASVTSVGPPLAASTDKAPSLGDLLSGLSDQASGSSASQSGSSSEQSDSKVTTVVIASTIVVPPKPSGTDTPSASGSGPESGSDSSSPSSFPASPLPSTGSNKTTTEASSTKSLPPLIILPTDKSSETSTSRPTTVANSTTSESESDSPSASQTPTPSSSSSSSGILLAPTGVVTSTTSEGPLAGIGGLLSSIVSDVTDALGPTANATKTEDKTADPTTGSSSATKAPSAPASSDPIISIPLTLLPPGTGSSTATAPPETYVPPVTNATDGVTVPPTTTARPTDPTTIPDLNATITDIPTSNPPVTSLPTTIVTISPNTTSNGNVTIPTSAPPTTYDQEPTSVSSIPTGDTTGTGQPWLPTTIVVDPTPTTTTTGGLAPTSAVSIPTALPKAITPETATDPQPVDTTLIQIGFGFGMNYPFVVGNAKAAAQIFQLLPQALSYAGGFGMDKVQMRKLIPLNTQQSLGYVTTLAIVTYPSNMVETLRMDVKIPSSALYSHPEQLVYNLTEQINPAIDIILGSYPEDGAAPGENGASSALPTSVSNSDPFDNDADTEDSSSSQKGATAGIAFGVVGVAAAYGAAMFLIARRYKRKKQAHRRASSISDSSGMRTVGSPPLMGGALLSRDFSSYGGVAGGRDSQGSGRSGGNSARTAVISPPVAAENSLGWN